MGCRLKANAGHAGEFAYLTGRLLQNLDDGHMEFHMICLKCAEYFAKKLGRQVAMDEQQNRSFADAQDDRGSGASR